MTGLITGLDKTALLITSLYLFIYLIKKNNLVFLLSAHLLILSNWYFLIPDSYATVMVYDCMCVLLSGLALSFLRSNPILFLSQLLFFVFSSIAYVVDALYYYLQNQFFYNLSLTVFELYPFIFWPYLVFNVIGLLKGTDNDGRHINNSNTAFCDNYLYDDSKFLRNMGYYEKRN